MAGAAGAREERRGLWSSEAARWGIWHWHAERKKKDDWRLGGEVRTRELTFPSGCGEAKNFFFAELKKPNENIFSWLLIYLHGVQQKNVKIDVGKTKCSVCQGVIYVVDFGLVL